MKVVKCDKCGKNDAQEGAVCVWGMRPISGKHKWDLCDECRNGAAEILEPYFANKSVSVFADIDGETK